MCVCVCLGVWVGVWACVCTWVCEYICICTVSQRQYLYFCTSKARKLSKTRSDEPPLIVCRGHFAWLEGVRQYLYFCSSKASKLWNKPTQCPSYTIHKTCRGQEHSICTVSEFVFVFIHMYASISVRVYVLVCMYTWVCECVCAVLSVYTHVYIVYIPCVCVCVCVYVYINVYIYILVYIGLSLSLSLSLSIGLSLSLSYVCVRACVSASVYCRTAARNYHVADRTEDLDTFLWRARWVSGEMRQTGDRSRRRMQSWAISKGECAAYCCRGIYDWWARRPWLDIPCICVCVSEWVCPWVCSIMCNVHTQMNVCVSSHAEC